MINIHVQNNQALIQIDGQVSVCVSLDPSPAERVTVGYTPLAWIWCTVNNALEAANVDLSFADSCQIANQISEKLSTTGSSSMAKIAYAVLPFLEIE